MSRFFNRSANDNIDCGANIRAPSAITIAAWVQITSSISNYLAIYSRNNSPNGFHQLFANGSSSHMAYYVNANGGTVDVDPGAATFALNTWFHTAMTYDGVANLATYFNGASDGTSGAGTGALSTNFGGVHTFLGEDSGNAGRFFPGVLTDVAMWTVPLSAQEIYALSKGVLRPYQLRPASLACYYPLNGYGAQALDASGNGNTGVLSGTSFEGQTPQVISASPFFPGTKVFKTPAASTFLAAWALQRNVAIEGVAT